MTEHNLEFLRLKGGCTGWSESTLVKMPHYRKSHVTAHLIFFNGNQTVVDPMSWWSSAKGTSWHVP